MERIKSKQVELPDAINCSLTKDFTQVPNELIKNPNISGKAKAIQFLLLSNKDGWISHVETICKFMKEGRDAIRAGLKELEDNGYLIRIYYRNKKTKRHQGSFWAYTDIPYSWNITEHLQWLEDNNLEMINNEIKPVDGKPVYGNPNYGKTRTNNININNTNKKNTNNKFVPTKKNGKKSIQERNLKYLPIAKELSRIIQENKNIGHTPIQLKSWTNHIRQLNEANGVNTKRIDNALDWYADHIGEQYCPVIESGSSLRDKFTKLEAAMERSNNTKKVDRKKRDEDYYADYGDSELDETLRKAYGR